MSAKQPAHKILYDQRWSVTTAADEMGISSGHLRCALYATATPSPELRERLPKLLNVPLEELFTPELLDREYIGSNQYARRRKAS